jgi:hypothetical protein
MLQRLALLSAVYLEDEETLVWFSTSLFTLCGR